MEENFDLNLKEKQDKVNYSSNSKKLRKKGKGKFKKLFNKTKLIIRNQFKKSEIKNNDNNIDNNNINKQIKKERNPGVELVRLLTMYVVVVIHYLNFGKAYQYFYIHQRTLRLIQSFIDWQNNAFILISGIVGYKTNKYSNLSYLWLMVVFYSVGINNYITTYKKEFHVNQDINKLYYPMVYNSYWYFTTYFGMYLF